MRAIAGMARSYKSAPAQGSLLLKSQQKSPAIAGLFHGCRSGTTALIHS